MCLSTTISSSCDDDKIVSSSSLYSIIGIETKLISRFLAIVGVPDFLEEVLDMDDLGLLPLLIGLGL